MLERKEAQDAGLAVTETHMRENSRLSAGKILQETKKSPKLTVAPSIARVDWGLYTVVDKCFLSSFLPYCSAKRW